MTYSDLADLALTLPEVEERPKKTEVDLVRGKGHIGRLRERGSAFAFRLPWELVDRLLAEQPDVFFVTPHYRGWPYLLAWLEKLEPDQALDLLKASWDVAPIKLPVRKQH